MNSPYQILIQSHNLDFINMNSQHEVITENRGVFRILNSWY